MEDKRVKKKIPEEGRKYFEDLLVGKKPLPISPVEITDFTLKILGDGSVCFGKVSIAFKKKSLSDFFSVLDEEKKKMLARSIRFFQIYMEPLGYIAKNTSGKSKGYFDNIPRSIVAIHVIFSIVENITNTEPRKDFVKFLEEHFDEIKDKADFKVLSKKHREMYPANGTRCEVFYKEYLTKKEQDELVKDYKSWQGNHDEEFKDIETVIADIYGSVRSGFSHNLGYDHLRREDFGFKLDKDGNLSAHGNVSIDRFSALSWLAIFRYFGFKFDTDN